MNPLYKEINDTYVATICSDKLSKDSSAFVAKVFSTNTEDGLVSSIHLHYMNDMKFIGSVTPKQKLMREITEDYDTDKEIQNKIRKLIESHLRKYYKYPIEGKMVILKIGAALVNHYSIDSSDYSKVINYNGKIIDTNQYISVKTDIGVIKVKLSDMKYPAFESCQPIVLTKNELMNQLLVHFGKYANDSLLVDALHKAHYHIIRMINDGNKIVLYYTGDNRKPLLIYCDGGQRYLEKALELGVAYPKLRRLITCVPPSYVCKADLTNSRRLMEKFNENN